MFKFFAKSNTQEDPAERISLNGSNVLGATGLSRRALRQYVSQYGLFGGDSELDAAEQATVRAALSSAARGTILAANDRGTAGASAKHLDAVGDFASAAVSGGGSVSRAEWTRGEAAGLSQGLRGEVLAVVGLLKETFGLSPPLNWKEARVGRVAGEPARRVLRAA